jgi:peptidoglycan/LPS O-acetylase OafA/YrhL
MTTKTWFRADVQALRALAVTLVVAYHFAIPGFHGGFFGVDVFFVLSGYVITEVLLRRNEATLRSSLMQFYARRIRRILPLASIVIVLTVFATYHYLAYITGASNASDAKYVIFFVGNFHFAALGTQYFSQQNPPSTLQQFWTLAVEEQFYVVWPLTFLILTRFWQHWSARTKLAVFLVIVIAASLAWCIVETGESPIWAFFSPLTRAWEIGLGALIAVIEPKVLRRSKVLGVSLGVAGLAVLLACTWIYTSSTSWPGTAVIAPVVATGAILVGGSLVGPQGFSGFVTWRPIQWIGDASYSWYLVHWPIIAIATQYTLEPLRLMSRLELMLLSLVIAGIAYYLVDRPVRQWTWLKQHQGYTYLMGCFLLMASYGCIEWHLHNY